MRRLFIFSTLVLVSSFEHTNAFSTNPCALREPVEGVKSEIVMRYSNWFSIVSAKKGNWDWKPVIENIKMRVRILEISPPREIGEGLYTCKALVGFDGKKYMAFYMVATKKSYSGREEYDDMEIVNVFEVK